MESVKITATGLPETGPAAPSVNYRPGRSRRGTSLVAGALVLALYGLAGPAPAADTIETWAVGATNVDFYMGMEGIGLPRAEGVVYGDIMLGYGLIDRFSAYLGTTLQGDRYLGQAVPQHYLGVYGTVLESDHVDLDLFLDVSGASGEMAITPSFEFNLDLEPDMARFGLYLRGGAVLQHSGEDDEPKMATVLAINPGLYWSLNGRSMAFLEASTGFHPNPAAGVDKWDEGHLHLGYNRVLVDEIELITEVNWSLNQADGARPWGGFMGIIVTMPGGGK